MKIKIDDYLSFIQEIKKTSVSTISRNAKINRAAGSLAAQMAKEKDDPIYDKMLFYKDNYLKYKKQLMKKYRHRVLSQARK